VTGFLPAQTLESVFNVPTSFELGNNTLLQALSFQGGSDVTSAASILLRVAVASQLNAAHPDVYYPRTPSGIIVDVNEVLANGDRSAMLDLAQVLDAYNNLGCPLN